MCSQPHYMDDGVLAELSTESGVVAALAALGEADEELTWACKSKQICAGGKEKRVFLGLTYLAVYTFNSDYGPDYAQCRQRLRCCDIKASFVGKGGLQLALMAEEDAHNIVMRFSKKTAQGKEDAEVFLEEVQRQYSDIVGEDLTVHHDNGDISALCAVTAKQEKEHIARLAALIAPKMLAGKSAKKEEEKAAAKKKEAEEKAAAKKEDDEKAAAKQAASDAAKRKQEDERTKKKQEAEKAAHATGKSTKLPAHSEEEEGGGGDEEEEEEKENVALMQQAAWNEEEEEDDDWESEMQAEAKRKQVASNNATSSKLSQQGRLNGAASAMEQKVAKRSMTDPATIRASETASKVALLKKCVDLIEEKSRSGVTGGGSLPTMSPQAFAGEDFEPGSITGKSLGRGFKTEGAGVLSLALLEKTRTETGKELQKVMCSQYPQFIQASQAVASLQEDLDSLRVSTSETALILSSLTRLPPHGRDSGYAVSSATDSSTFARRSTGNAVA